LKEAILAGVNGANKSGVAGFVCDLAQDIPTSAAALLGRLIPVNMAGGVWEIWSFLVPMMRCKSRHGFECVFLGFAPGRK
jgi:hypothetical protein